MIIRNDQDHGPGAVGRELAELGDRLRLCVGAGLCRPQPAWADRIGAGAALLRVVARELDDPGLAGAAAGAARLATALAEGAELDADLRWRLNVLDLGLAALVACYDAGADADQLRRHPAWQALLRPCPRPLCGDGALPAAASGNAANDAAPLAGRLAGVDGAAALLLIGSPFLQDLLCSRLAAAGRRPVPVTGPEQAAVLLDGTSPPDLVICDDEAPTHHLKRLRRMLTGAARGQTALVLVVSAAGAAAEPGRRARAAGADAVWAEPWHPERITLLEAAPGIL